MAAPDTHIATQTINDGEQCPAFLDGADVGNVQYSGLTRFLQVKTSTVEHHSQNANEHKYNSYIRP